MADERNAEPLPIWFFVGVILAVYGLLVLVAAFMGGEPPTRVTEMHPGLWWGAILVAAGGLFTAIGLVAHRKNA